MLSLLVRNGMGPRVPVPLRRQLRRWLGRALAAAGCPDATVCLSLSDDAELHALNLQYADEDHATDVLSFAQQEAPAGPGFAPPPDPDLLGDIVISIDTAERQARQHGHGLDAELLHLAVHGLCHLLGYDHATQSEEQVMFTYEAQLRTEARGRRQVQLQARPPFPRPHPSRSPETALRM